jgi:multisubunit Na+/H+ antiporter MnhG subunit
MISKSSKKIMYDISKLHYIYTKHIRVGYIFCFQYLQAREMQSSQRSNQMLTAFALVAVAVLVTASIGTIIIATAEALTFRQSNRGVFVQSQSQTQTTTSGGGGDGPDH